MLGRGLAGGNGLERYIAVPLFRTIPLENYLRGYNDTAPRLTQQAALVLAQILQDSMNNTGGSPIPIIFERDLPTLTTALFEGARSTPGWQYTIALHRLGSLLGRYWGEISRGSLHDQRIVQQVYACLPMMPAIERWINSTRRDVLVQALAHQEETFQPTLKTPTNLP